jgi:hypothetical protein
LSFETEFVFNYTLSWLAELYYFLIVEVDESVALEETNWRFDFDAAGVALTT